MFVSDVVLLDNIFSVLVIVVTVDTVVVLVATLSVVVIIKFDLLCVGKKRTFLTFAFLRFCVFCVSFTGPLSIFRGRTSDGEGTRRG